MKKRTLNKKSAFQISVSKHLSQEDKHIWSHFIQDIVPLKNRLNTSASHTEISLSSPKPDQDAKTQAVLTKKSISLTVNSVQKNVPQKVLPPLVSLETKVIRSLKKGKRDIEGKLDLHGMYQEEAYAAIRSFLLRSRSQGKTLVLIVTGKGNSFSSSPFEQKGVLKRMLPHWLSLPEFRSFVVGFEEASIRHGGSGAYYVRLRKSIPQTLY